jgi:hypothetical protein
MGQGAPESFHGVVLCNIHENGRLTVYLNCSEMYKTKSLSVRVLHAYKNA